MRYPYSPLRMAKMKTTVTRPNASREKLDTHRWWEQRTARLLGETARQLLQKRNLPKPTTVWPSNCTPGYLLQRNGNLFSYKILSTDVHGSFICNNRNWKQARCLGWMNSLINPVHPYRGRPLSNRTQRSTDTCSNRMNIQGIALSERTPVPKV